MPVKYNRRALALAVAGSTGWADLMRKLDIKPNGGRRRSLQKAVAEHGIDTSHFKKQSPWRKYSDAALSEAVASSATLREVVAKFGAKPATGTLSHIRRRIAHAGIDASHFPHLSRPQAELCFSIEELSQAAAASNSIRAMARLLGVRDDGRSRAALRRCLAEFAISTRHFSHARGRDPRRQTLRSGGSVLQLCRCHAGAGSPGRRCQPP